MFFENLETIMTHTIAARVEELMSFIWEGGPVMNLETEDGQEVENVGTILSKFFPDAWASRQAHDPNATGDDPDDEFTIRFSDGSSVVINRMGSSITEGFFTEPEPQSA